MKEAFHGSDIEKIEERYGIPAGEIVSFASNVSPLGVSDKYIKEIGDKLYCVEKYPDRDYRALRSAIGKYCGIDPCHIVVGGGSSELIGAVIKHKKKPRTLLIAPAYAEYERNVIIAGGTCEYFYLKESDGFILDAKGLLTLLDESFDLLMICNPVNPTSTAIDRKTMDLILKACDELDIICAVDETYIDFAAERYDASYLAGYHKSLFVIRSMSKFFCAPGLRLGYGITSNDRLLREIEENKDPWSVSSLSNEAAILMLSDKEYIKKAKHYMEAERERVCKRLDTFKGYGIKYYMPRANFVLLHLPDGTVSSADLFERAITDKMMIRDCADFKGLNDTYIRFCFMGSADNDRLLDLLEETYS